MAKPRFKLGQNYRVTRQRAYIQRTLIRAINTMTKKATDWDFRYPEVKVSENLYGGL